MRTFLKQISNYEYFPSFSLKLTLRR